MGEAILARANSGGGSGEKFYQKIKTTGSSQKIQLDPTKTYKVFSLYMNSDNPGIYVYDIVNGAMTIDDRDSNGTSIITCSLSSDCVLKTGQGYSSSYYTLTYIIEM